MRPTLSFIFLLVCGVLSGQSYQFKTVTDQYENYKKVGQSNEMSYIVDGQRMATEMYMTGLRIMANVVNYEDSTMTMITYAGTSASGFQKKLPGMNAMSADTTAEHSSPADNAEKKTEKKVEKKFQRTDETKEMDGYMCRKYERDGPDIFMEIWLLEGHDKLDFFGLQNKMMGSMPAGPAGGPKMDMALPFEHGFPMEIYTEQKNKKKTSTLMRVTSLKLDEIDTSVFDLSNVEMIDLGDNKKEK